MNTITKVALSNDKKNKTRSVLVMVTILLTTALLTIIGIYANGLLKMNKLNAAAQYGSYYGIFQSVKGEQIQEIERRGEISDIGFMASAGIIDSDKEVNLISMDEQVLKMTNMDTRLAMGYFPERDNEIVAEPTFFRDMGYPDVKIGDSISLPYRSDMAKTYEEVNFVVSGLLLGSNSDLRNNSYVVCCSKDFYESRYEEDSRRYHTYFKLDESVSVTIDNVEDMVKDLAKKCGIEEKSVSVNMNYLNWTLDPGYETILVCSVLAFCVILFSVVVVYNIFQVGIVQKIQEYGKMKALGATNKQMRMLIYREGMFLTIFSIPAGLLLGYLIAWCSFQWLMDQNNALSKGSELEMVSLFSFPMILLSAALALLTVSIALRKPMKIVAGISPVEAIRYLESSSYKKSGLRKGKKDVSVFSMALANITGNRKRTVSTILTMGLSCVLFVIIANCVGNIDEEYDARKSINHGQFQINLEYELHDEAYPESNLDAILKNNPLNQQLLDQIKALHGVTNVQTRQILAAVINGSLTSISVMNLEDFNAEKSDTNIGNMDYNEGSENRSIYFGWAYFLEYYGYSLNQSITMKLYNGTEERTYEGTLSGAFGSADTYWVLPEDGYKALNISGDSTGYVWIDCEEKDVERIQQELKALIDGIEHIELLAYSEVLKTSELGSKVLQTGCYLFMAIIGLIGFMNLANTMIISIITQKHEYGILQAVGMTNAQLNQSLQLQGLIFTVGTVLVALVVGLPAGYGIFEYCKSKGIFGINVYHIPFLEIGLMILIIAVLQLGLLFILSRNLKKETLVERIRYQG